MAWIKRQWTDVHKCNPPFLSFLRAFRRVTVGDLWQCDECQYIWEVRRHDDGGLFFSPLCKGEDALTPRVKPEICCPSDDCCCSNCAPDMPSTASQYPCHQNDADCGLNGGSAHCEGCRS